MPGSPLVTNIWTGRSKHCWTAGWRKRSLLYGGFMVGITTVLLCSLGIFIGNSWADKRNDKAMEEILWTLAAYMALAAVVVSRESPEVPGGTFRDCKRSPRPRASPGFGSSPVQK